MVFVQHINDNEHGVENDVVKVKHNANHLKGGVVGVVCHVVEADVAKKHGTSPAQQGDDKIKADTGFFQLQAHKMA